MHVRLTFLGTFSRVFGDFKNHIRGISSKLLRHMGYDGHGQRKISQGITITIVVELRVKHEGLGFTGV